MRGVKALRLSEVLLRGLTRDYSNLRRETEALIESWLAGAPAARWGERPAALRACGGALAPAAPARGG